MEKLIAVKPEYASLEKIEAFVKKETSFEAKQEYDSWDVRTDANGQMEKCIVIKKSSMHGVKLYFLSDTTIQIDYIIPSKMMNAFFGKSQKRYKSILEIIGGKIRDIALASSQQKAFEEIENELSRMVA